MSSDFNAIETAGLYQEDKRKWTASNEMQLLFKMDLSDKYLQFDYGNSVRGVVHGGAEMPHITESYAFDFSKDRRMINPTVYYSADDSLVGLDVVGVQQDQSSTTLTIGSQSARSFQDRACLRSTKNTVLGAKSSPSSFQFIYAGLDSDACKCLTLLPEPETHYVGANIAVLVLVPSVAALMTYIGHRKALKERDEPPKERSKSPEALKETSV